MPKIRIVSPEEPQEEEIRVRLRLDADGDANFETECEDGTWKIIAFLTPAGDAYLCEEDHPIRLSGGVYLSWPEE